MMKFLDQLMSSGNLERLLTTSTASNFSLELFFVTKSEITKCGEPNKLVASIDVFCGLLQAIQNQTTIAKTLVQLSIFLCHKFPRIRKVTAAKFFEAILMYEDVVPEENMDQVKPKVPSKSNYQCQYLFCLG